MGATSFKSTDWLKRLVKVMISKAKCWVIVIKIFNSILLVAGLGAVGCAGWILILDVRFLFLSRMANQNFSEDPMKHYSLLEVCGYILLAAGLLLICLSALGFLGVYTMKRRVLGIYAICICLMVVLQLAAGVLGALYIDSFRMIEVKKQMLTSLQVRYQGPILNDTGLFASDVEFSHSFDYAQVSLQCCGAESGSDFTIFTEWNRTWYDSSGSEKEWRSWVKWGLRSVLRLQLPDLDQEVCISTVMNGLFLLLKVTRYLLSMARVPFTCCRVKDGGDPDEADNMRLIELISYIKDQSCPLKPVAENSNFLTGCYEKLSDLYSRLSSLIIGVGTFLVIVEIAGGASAYRLCRFLQRDFEDFDVW